MLEDDKEEKRPAAPRRAPLVIVGLGDGSVRKIPGARPRLAPLPGVTPPAAPSAAAEGNKEQAKLRRIEPGGARVLPLPAPAPEPPPPADRAPAPNARKRIPGLFYSSRYKPVRLLGQGARGTVYKAEDRVLDIFVAIKLLPELLALDKEAVELIKHEATLAMKLSHDNIVRLHNVEVESGRLFLVMEYVDGQNFRQILRKTGKLSLNSVLSVAASCAGALDYAHQRGILHRDLKPENLMVNQESVLKIVDFGTAMMVHHRHAGPDYIEGTPSYMSPEQIRCDPLDCRTDVFSLGVVFSELLTGRCPFPFDNDIHKVLEAEPAPMPQGSPAVVEVLVKAMAKRREDRWAGVGEFCDALVRAAEGDRGHR